MKPDEIERESFKTILAEMGPHSFSAFELPIVQRVIHATADFDYAHLLRFSPNAIENGIQALRSGCRLICDVRMIAAGVSRARLERLGCPVLCQVDDAQVAELARQSGGTRSEAAMRRFGADLSGAVVAIGNAPTALLEVLRLYETEAIRPALVVGVPVGFVNAAESKQLMTQSALDYITTDGRKGGSTVAVAILNALLRLAGD